MKFHHQLIAYTFLFCSFASNTMDRQIKEEDLLLLINPLSPQKMAMPKACEQAIIRMCKERKLISSTESITGQTATEMAEIAQMQQDLCKRKKEREDLIKELAKVKQEIAKIEYKEKALSQKAAPQKNKLLRKTESHLSPVKSVEKKSGRIPKPQSKFALLLQLFSQYNVKSKLQLMEKLKEACDDAALTNNEIFDRETHFLYGKINSHHKFVFSGCTGAFKIIDAKAQYMDLPHGFECKPNCPFYNKKGKEMYSKEEIDQMTGSDSQEDDLHLPD
jgi:hypothetical protein